MLTGKAAFASMAELSLGTATANAMLIMMSMQETDNVFAFCCRHGMLFVETSAKTAANTSELFEMIARKIAASQSTVTQPQQTASQATAEANIT